MSKMHEDDKGWRDTRVIDAETLRQLDRDMLKKSPEPKQGEKKGNPSKDGGDGYTDGGCPR